MLVLAMEEGRSIEYDPPCPNWKWFLPANVVRPKGKLLRDIREAAVRERARMRLELLNNKDALSKRVKFLERTNGLPVNINKARTIAGIAERQ
jgi:hypothetical protein